MATMTLPDTGTDPAVMTAMQWGTRLAALKSRQVPDTDPRVIECHASLAYWRVRRVLDAERGHIDAAHIEALAGHLRQAVFA